MNKSIWLIVILSILFIGCMIHFNGQKDYSKWQVIKTPKEEITCKKETILSVIPYSVRFTVHTFPFMLTKKQCISLHQDAFPYLSPSKIYNVHQDHQHLIRNSMSCSIVNKESELVRLMASQLSGYPLSHIEHTQVVRYEEGEGFGEHYDTDPTDKNNPSWSRIATFMIYLNEECIGGETEFPVINKMIQPETGKGVFWWNVMGGEIIPECKHKGRFVISGTKWIINTWVHSIPIQDQ